MENVEKDPVVLTDAYRLWILDVDVRARTLSHVQDPRRCISWRPWVSDERDGAERKVQFSMNLVTFRTPAHDRHLQGRPRL